MSRRSQQKKLAFMDIAWHLATLGTCDRKQVGCLIVRDGRCVSWGFNGAPPGLPHCEENMHGWGYGLGDSGFPPDLDRQGCLNATHAEANALAAAARQGISTDHGQLFTTLSPCDDCSRLIIAAGIVRVFYHEEYRDRSGLITLAAAGIESLQL